MFRLTYTIHPDDEDELVANLSEHDLAGISQYNRDDGQLDLIAWFTTRPAAELAQSTIIPPTNDTLAPDDNRGVPPPPTIDEIPNQNWNATYQATWQPVEVGQRFYLAPPGDKSPTPTGRQRLELKPGLAFGNGDHPTTHLCLAAMEQLLSKGDIFLDVGCGSGLLAKAAHLLEASALGCDLDPTDLPTNSFQGSLDAVKLNSIDVAVMNIQAGVLADLWPHLAQIAKRHAILSGFLPNQLPQIEALIHPPWCTVERKEKDGWCALVATRSADPAPPR